MQKYEKNKYKVEDFSTPLRFARNDVVCARHFDWSGAKWRNL